MSVRSDWLEALANRFVEVKRAREEAEALFDRSSGDEWDEALQLLDKARVTEREVIGSLLRYAYDTYDIPNSSEYLIALQKERLRMQRLAPQDPTSSESPTADSMSP